MSSLPESMKVEIQEVVGIFDKVGDAKVDVNDIVNILRSLELNPGSNDWDEQIKQFHMDNKSRLDIEDFYSIYEEETNRKRVSEKDMLEAIKAIDPQNGEIGLVGRAALTRSLTIIGDKMTQAECDAILDNAMDRDGKTVMVNTLMRYVMGEL